MNNLDELGPYTRTISLTKVHFFNPRACEIKIDDVAHHLAKSGRFNNGIDPHYSVAEHSVLMAHWFLNVFPGTLATRTLFAQYASVHDTGEYLFGDLPAPLKKFLPDFNKFQTGFDSFMLKHFGLLGTLPEEVDIIDKRFCATEQRILRRHEPDTYSMLSALEDVVFHCWSWQEAKDQFLILFSELFPNYRDTDE